MRTARLDDVPAIARLWEESVHAAWAPLLPETLELPGTPDAEARLHETLQSPDASLAVAAREQDLLGYVGFGSSRDAGAPDDTGEVRGLFVRPDEWGAGVGSALIAHALERLAAAGYRSVTLWSFADNARANAFYEARGFRADGARQSKDVWGHAQEVRLRRALEPRASVRSPA